MNTVDVKLLNFAFRFRQLTWREEFKIKYDPKKDRLRTMLVYALDEISGLKVTSIDDAWRVLDAIPSTVIRRVFVMYKGGLPESRQFVTTGLYKAPETSKFVKKFEEIEEKREEVMDKIELEMEQKFGRKELEEARAAERLMAKNSKLRGLTPASPDRKEYGVPPPEKK